LEDGLIILLDKRPVRTASKAILSVPANKRQLAAAIALEWDLLVSAQQALKQYYIPLTSLTSRAIDIQAGDRDGKSSIRDDIIKMLLRYLSTDTLLCWAPEKNAHESPIEEGRNTEKESLRSLQMRTAQPIIAHLTSSVWPGAEIVPTMDPDSILPKPQPAETIEIVRRWLSRLPAFELAGLERAVLAGKSLLIGTRLLVEWSQEFAHARPKAGEKSEQRFGIEEAAEACSLEVRWQTEMWGEVEDTHDVDKEDLRRQLGSVVVLVNG
jgi:chaperone required for assembly of F1-ATPase